MYDNFCIVRNVHLEKFFCLFHPFSKVNFFTFDIFCRDNDYIKPTATFTAWVKCFFHICIMKVAGLGKIFAQIFFWLYSMYITASQRGHTVVCLSPQFSLISY